MKLRRKRLGGISHYYKEKKLEGTQNKLFSTLKEKKKHKYNFEQDKIQLYLHLYLSIIFFFKL